VDTGPQSRTSKLSQTGRHGLTAWTQDNSDSQYAGFRDNIPYMTVVVILHPLLRRLYDGLRRSPPTTKTSNGSVGSLSSSISADARLRQRTSFDLYFALLFIVALHGFSALKILVILYINFNIAMQLPKQAIPAATWLFNIGVLFANELAHGYRFTQIAETMLPFPMAIALAKSLDLYGGLIPRWEILFNITVLRLIAFNLDYYWSLGRDRTGSPLEVRIYLNQGTLVAPIYHTIKQFLTRQRRSSLILHLFRSGTVWPYQQLHLLSSPSART
jgi:protein-cysteine N-palmitoyltransferase HHAT